MVEVFYEQLNFEMLTESEAYGVSIDYYRHYYFLVCQPFGRFWWTARLMVRHFFPDLL
jgi:hypothetical protein